MVRLNPGIWFLGIGLSAWLLTGCEVARSGEQAADIAQFAPPPAAVVAQSSGLIRFEPTSRQLNTGETADFQLHLDNVTSLTEVNLELRFTPGIIEVQDNDSGIEGIQIRPGDFFNADYVGDNQVDNAAGVIRYNALPEATSGSGLLATITFRAIAPGSTGFTFAVAELAGEDGSLEPVATQPGQLTVIGEPVSGATPLPGQPTLTPTLLPLVTVAPTATPTVTPSPQPTATLTPTPLPTATNTPAAPAVQIPPGATLGFCYRVQPYDTLPGLAQMHGTDPYFISLANDLYPPGHIYPQQVLFMPTTYGNGPNVYAVKPNDTLAGIAEQCQMEVEVLAYVNGLPETANLSGIPQLIIPRPPYAPPSRYGYPQVGPPSVWPPPCEGAC